MQVSVGELSRAAEANIANGEFVDGFTLLTLAQETASSATPHLEQDDAIYFGSALALAGHALFNYYIDADGRDLPRDHGPASDADGMVKFREAAEIFQYAIRNDPQDSRAYLGLSAMQWELGHDVKDTVAQLEDMLEEDPTKDCVKVRLAVANHYQRVEDDTSAMMSYAKAVDCSVGERHNRHAVASIIKDHLRKCADIDPAAFQRLKSSCIRAVIQDPDDLSYNFLLSKIEEQERRSELLVA